MADRGDEKDSERYIVIDGRRWRRADPSIPASLHQQLVNQLMQSRRAVKSALAAGDDNALRRARARVQDAKLALGERGRAWWLPPEDDATRVRLAAAIRALLRQRDPGKTICPSEVARIVGASQWRDLMPVTREVAARLVAQGWLEITQKGVAVDNPTRGAIRLRRKRRPDA